MRYRFDDIEIDRGAYRAMRGDEELSLQPKMFELLCHLVVNRPTTVSRDELLATFWPNERVGDAVVTWTVSHIRKQLGQSTGSRFPIETVHGRGYRFIAEVTELDESRQDSPQDAGTTTLARPLLAPFVGRAEETRRLEAALAGAYEGSGGLYLLLGESGIGKTRCVEESAGAARDRGATIVTGRAVHSGPLLWPWLQVLRELGQRLPSVREDVERLDAELVELAPEADDNETTGGQRGRRFWFYESLLSVLAKAAALQPLVVVLEDIHQADQGSIELLRFVATELRKHALLMIATAHDQAAGGLQALRGWRSIQVLALRRLSADDIAEYLVAAGRLQAPPPPDLVDAVQRATAGIPLFVQETVRALLARHGSDGLDDLPASAVEPSDVARDVLARRIAQLPEPTQSLLATASVLGHAFDLATLETVSDVSADTQIRLLQVACDAGLVAPDTPHRYRFTHDLHHAVLYDGMSSATRIEIHRRAAKALEAQPVIEGRLGAVAYHYYRSMPAGDYDAVVDACCKAAQAASAVFTPSEAARYFSWALEAQPFQSNLTPRARAELLMKAVQAQRNAGQDAEARTTAQGMLEMARQHDFVDLLVSLAKTLRPSSAVGGVPDAMAQRCLEDALKRLPQDSTVQRVEVMALLSGVPPYSTDMERCQEMAGEALSRARELGDRATLRAALRANLYALSGPDHDEELLVVVDELLAIGERLPPGLALDAHTAKAGVAYLRGHIEAGDAAIDRLSGMRLDYDLPEIGWYLLRHKAQRQLRAGNLALCGDTITELARRGQRMGLSYAKEFCIALWYELERAKTGGWMPQTGARVGARRDDAPVGYLVFWARGAAKAGELGLAGELLARLATGGFAAIPKALGYLDNLCQLSTVSVDLPGHPHAQELYDRLLPYARVNARDSLLRYNGCVARFLAPLATALGAHDAAREHHALASDINATLSHLPALAETHLAHAQWLDNHGKPADRPRVRELATRACEVAQQAGMAWVVNACHPLM